MIAVTDTIALDEREIAESFLRASGPGGQHVNKVESAVQIRFDARRSPSLTDEVRQRLERLAGHRLTQDGVIVITVRSHRSQDRNRQEAVERLVALIREAAVRPRTRRPTRPTLASKRRRLESKARRAQVKTWRGTRSEGD